MEPWVQCFRTRRVRAKAPEDEAEKKTLYQMLRSPTWLAALPLEISSVNAETAAGKEKDGRTFLGYQRYEKQKEDNGGKTVEG